CMQGLEFPYSF
nr:immunoglobulin light chain junction region [Macaca mulatta]MOV34030.1 immunoglobulin light chain junction region [Macaca mulatta]MOV34059.1 immunoglobulin light chain junction region [Macaca mulatta]MOV34112.1 immunoglobulin light chain junction region [Macaca mulatta]MOV34115.1 immunoglobulin light chain junction region [Macaca mulatta]